MATDKWVAPEAIYEFVMAQLILRSVGFKTSEMEVVLNAEDASPLTKTTDVDLLIQRGDKQERIGVGTIKLTKSKVNKMWVYWLDVASKDMINNFDTYKQTSGIFKGADLMLTHLAKRGFVIQDTAILETDDR